MAHAATEMRKVVAATAAEVGASVLAFAKTRSGHQRALLRTPAGREVTFVFPGTPGDYRSARNMRSQIKRMVRGRDASP
jgi:hypothetical protein